MTNSPSDPLESRLIALLKAGKIDFTRPEDNEKDPTTIDFHLTKFDIYIEVAQFYTERKIKQLSTVPERKTVILLQGPRAVDDFIRIINHFFDLGRRTYEKDEDSP